MRHSSARSRLTCPTTTRMSRPASASTPVKSPSTSPPHCPLPPWRGRNSPMKRTRRVASSTPMHTLVSATTVGSTPCVPPAGAEPARSRTRMRSTAVSFARSTPSAVPPVRSARAKRPRASKTSSVRPTRAPSRPSAAGSRAQQGCSFPGEVDGPGLRGRRRSFRPRDRPRRWRSPARPRPAGRSPRPSRR